jgi:hypothetical protein
VQHVLLDRHRAERIQVAVVPAEVRVGVAESGHQGGPAAVDDLGAVAGQVTPGARAYLGDAVARDQHLAVVRVGAGAVDDADVGEQNRGHALSSGDGMVVVRRSRERSSSSRGGAIG